MAGLRRTVDDADDEVDIFCRAVNLDDEESDYDQEVSHDENSLPSINPAPASSSRQPKPALLIIPPASSQLNITPLQAGQVRLLKREPNAGPFTYVVKKPVDTAQKPELPPIKPAASQKNTTQDQFKPRHGRKPFKGPKQPATSDAVPNNKQRLEKPAERPAFYFHHERRCSEPDEEKIVQKQFVFHADEEEKQLHVKPQTQPLNNSRTNKEKWSHDGYEQLTQADAGNQKHRKRRSRRWRDTGKFVRHDVR